MKKDNNTKDWKKVREETERIIDEQEKEIEIENMIDEGSPVETPALTHADYEELEKALTLAEEKASNNEEKVRRVLADLENYRTRARKDIDEGERAAKWKVINSILPVGDSLEQALQLVDKEAHPAMAEGLELTMQLFLDALKKNNVEQIDP